MSNRSRAQLLHTSSHRSWLQRGGILLMMMVAVSLLVMGKSNNASVLKLRMHLMDMAVPVLSFVASPVDSIYKMGRTIGEYTNLHEENLLLKNQNVELLKWQSAAKAMAVENEALRKLMRVVPEGKSNFVTARFISDMSGPYMHSALLGSGSEAGIKKDQAAINEYGLIGRVVEVGQNSARILLLGDINSRIPVMAETVREKAILAGNNTRLPTLSYLAANSKVTVGERIITSGDGGVFPKGIPVGVITAIEKGVVTVQPFVDPAGVEYLSVIDYSL